MVHEILFHFGMKNIVIIIFVTIIVKCQYKFHRLIIVKMSNFGCVFIDYKILYDVTFKSSFKLKLSLT
jgi:hypothetical protein